MGQFYIGILRMFLRGNHEIERTSTISGCKFNDENNNGNWDVNEPTISGWEIFLEGNDNNSVVTGEDGCYTFENVLPGWYWVSEESQEGWVQTYPDDPEYYYIELAGGQDITGLHFGNHFWDTATRTQGFWSTHFEAATTTWQQIPGNERMICSMDLGDGPINTDNGEMEGGFWSNVAKKTNDANRTDLYKARKRLAQQLIAAMLNVQAFGTNDNGAIDNALTAFAGTNVDAIDDAKDSLEAFNLSG